MSRMKILVYGAGPLGSLCAAGLSAAGANGTLLARMASAGATRALVALCSRTGSLAHGGGYTLPEVR
jgi:ketopantoate reductase